MLSSLKCYRIIRGGFWVKYQSGWGKVDRDAYFSAMIRERSDTGLMESYEV